MVSAASKDELMMSSDKSQTVNRPAFTQGLSLLSISVNLPAFCHFPNKHHKLLLFKLTSTLLISVKLISGRNNLLGNSFNPTGELSSLHKTISKWFDPMTSYFNHLRLKEGNQTSIIRWKQKQRIQRSMLITLTPYMRLKVSNLSRFNPKHNPTMCGPLSNWLMVTSHQHLIAISCLIPEFSNIFWYV